MLIADGNITIDTPDARLVDDLEDSPEGRLLTVTHQQRERNRVLVEKKKVQVIHQRG